MDRKEILDRKYSQLLLMKCLNFNRTNLLLIEYMTHEQDDFVKIIIDEARRMNIKNVQVYCSDSDQIHDYLACRELDEIMLNPLFDRSLWDEVAKKHGCILHINTFIPGLMDDIDKDKLQRMNQIIAPTFSYYKKNNKYNFPWVVCAYPNKRWAEFLFKNDVDAYSKLYNYIIEMCMVNRDSPLDEWNLYIKKCNYYKEIIQSMDIKRMYYKNALGTDFEIGFLEDYRWLNLDKVDFFGDSIIVNMPSYEIFTTPDYRTANGIVFNSKPLIFQGRVIDDFYIEFKDGIAVSYKAKIGDLELKYLIEKYRNSNRLGEVALVPNDSLISNTGIVFYNTLFDENSSCHFALGQGFSTGVIKDSSIKTQEELDLIGINDSNVHVDFMIGTPDLEIIADTKRGKKLIFKKGNFNI